MKVDRGNRNRLADAIRRYLDGKTTAFEFDDEIFEIANDSADATVDHVVGVLWCLYDDCQDHHVVLSKEAWDYCQRLILLLRSDAHVEIETHRRWSWLQIVAGAGLLAFVVCAVRLGIGYHLIAAGIPLGLLSMALSSLRNKWGRHLSSEEIAMVPFSCRSELMAVRRQVPTFSKRSFPAEIATRQIRSAAEESMLEFHRVASWLKSRRWS